MRPTDALATLRRMGLTLRPLTDGRLYVEPRDRITTVARQLIVMHRDSLVDLVRQQVSGGAADCISLALADPADLIVAYNERLAICFDAGDILEVEAHRTATDECGYSLVELIRWNSIATRSSNR